MRRDVEAAARMNFIERGIAFFAPKAAQQRQMARVQLALAGGYSGGGGRGGYTGARRDKASLSGYSPGGGSPTADIVCDLPMLRDRSRDQMRNAPVALGALNTATSHAVGTGLSCTPAPKAQLLKNMSEDQLAEWVANTKVRFELWAASRDCDVSRNLDFYGLQELAFRSWHESGDVFALTPRIARAGRPARLALQLLEADRVCTPRGKMDSDTLIDGIELDATTGEAVTVHVARKHPGDLRTAGNIWDPVPIRGEKTGRLNVLHIFKPLRPGQVRGVPWIAPIIEPLKQLARWSEAELNAAVTSAIFSMFVKMDAKAFSELFEQDQQTDYLDHALKNQWSGELESGKAVNLMPGEDINAPTPGRPNPEFDPFWKAVVRQIGMALELPYEILVMHFESSYSAARAALLMGWKFFRSRRDLMVKLFCQPVYELWLADEVSEGRISAPGFFASEVMRAAWCGAVWTGDGPGSIDPDKEVKAARARVDMEISTLDAESILHDGVDWATKHKQRKKEVELQKRDGTYVAPAGAPVAEPGAEDDQQEVDQQVDGAKPPAPPRKADATPAPAAAHREPVQIFMGNKPTRMRVTPTYGAKGEILHTLHEPLADDEDTQ